MRKLLLFIALGFIMLSSCNNGKTKGADEEIDSIALRAKKDTILSFNGHTLGKTSIKEFLASDGDVAASIYDKDAYSSTTIKVLSNCPILLALILKYACSGFCSLTFLGT